MRNKKTKEELESIALRVREHIIKMATKGGCFIGASLSCADLIVYLYSNYLNISRDTLKSKNRDYLFLSKGHDVPALYGTLAELNFIERDRLKNHLSTNDYIYWHPNTHIPGIEFHSGSLGHLLSVSIGVAYDCKLNKGKNKVVVILGDGELNEGSIWEACLTAGSMKLDNLIAVVDRNAFQANIRTEDLVPLEPLEKKFEAFGWLPLRCSGHDFGELEKVFAQIPPEKSKPTVVIAETIRGKGLPSIEARADRWFCNFSAAEIEALLEELHQGVRAKLVSETLVVR